jgi:hypothetical protein
MIFKDQFKKLDGSRVDLNKVAKKYPVDSPSKCAHLCANLFEVQALEANNDFACRSFDYCKDPNSDGYVCSFYNNSTLTDPSVIIESAPMCDHYASK